MPPEVDAAAARQIQTAKRRLAKITQELAASKAKDQKLRDERDAIVCRLRDANVPRTEIAELAGVSLDMVKLILSRRNGDG